VYDRIILHLGTPKTGTTGLQQYLSQNSEDLASKGAHYLKSFRRGPSHNYLMRLLRKGGKKLFIRNKLNAEIMAGEGGAAILSTETAYGVFGTTHVLKSLEPEVRKRVEILCYARRQDLFLEAMAKQKAKNALFRGELSSYCFDEKQRRKASYLSFADKIGNRFPEVSIQFRAFDRTQLKDGDVVQDFCAFAGLAPEDRPENPFSGSNRTPSLQVVEALRDHDFQGNVHRRNTLREIMKQDNKDFFRSRDVLPPEARERIIALYAGENDELFERYGDKGRARFSAFDASRDDNYIGDEADRTASRTLAREMVETVAEGCG